MNQFQKSYSLKNFLWWTWFWQSARSKTLHLVSSGRWNRPRRENFENSWKERFLEGNENKQVNISIYKRSVKCLRFQDSSSHFQVFHKKAILINYTKFTEKQSYSSLFFDKVLGLKLKKILTDYHWATIFAKHPLLVTSTSVTLDLGYSLMINYKHFHSKYCESLRVRINKIEFFNLTRSPTAQRMKFSIKDLLYWRNP